MTSWYASKTGRMGTCRFEVTTEERPGTIYFAPTAAGAGEVAARLAAQGIARESIVIADRGERS